MQINDLIDGKPLPEIPEEKRKKMTMTQKEMHAAQVKGMENLSKLKIYRCPDSSEDLASIVHLLLTITF